jgi:hypothetical protein
MNSTTPLNILNVSMDRAKVRWNPRGMIVRTYRLFMALLAIIVIACLFGVQGQFQVTPSTATPIAAQNSPQYTQFYTMTTAPATGNPIGTPQRFAIAGMPSTVYLGEQMQPVPYSQYQSSPAYTGANSLWIKGETAWTQYAVVPQGATVSLFAISPTRGSGSLTSDGQIYSNNYVFYPNSLLTFYAGTIGRHTLSFAINGQSSNQVVIDVVGGTYTQPNNNPVYTQPTNYPGYYPENYPGYSQEPWGYYPWDYYPSCPDGRQQCNGQCCPAGQICVNGNCETPSCPNGQQQCNGQCCPAGQICVNGNCESPPSENNYGGYSGSGVTSTNPVNVQSRKLSTSPVVSTPGTQPSEKGGAGGNSGDNNVQCDAGYHLENGNCVPDQVNPVQDNPIQDNTGKNPIQDNTGKNPIQDNAGKNPIQDNSGKNSVQDHSGNPVQDNPIQDNTGKNTIQDNSGKNPIQDNSGKNTVQANSGRNSVQDHSGNPVQDNTGGNNEEQCEAGYHLENSTCVPDR